MKNFLKNFDILGYSPLLYINQKQKHKTNLGVCISLFLWISLIYALVYYVLDTLVIRNGITLNYYKIRDYIPIHNLTDSKDVGFYFILLNDDYKPIQVDSDVMDMKYVAVKYYFENEQDPLMKNNVTSYDFEFCSEDSKEKVKDIVMNQKVIDLMSKSAYCPKIPNDTVTKLGGSLIYDQEMYNVKFILGPKCKKVNCTSEEMERYVNYTTNVATKVVISLLYNIPNPSQITHYKEKTLKNIMFDLKSSSNKVTFNIEEVKMNTEDRYIPMIGAKKIESFFTLKNYVAVPIATNPYSDYDQLTTEISLSVTDSINIYDRTYPTIDSIITRTVSFLFSLIFIGTFIRGCLHTYNLERVLINSSLINENSIKIHFNEDNSSSDLGRPIGKRKDMCKEEDYFGSLKESLYQDEIAEEDQGARGVNINPDTSISNSSSKIPNVCNISNKSLSNVLLIKSSQTKFEKIKSLFDSIKEYKVKISLRDRFSCSSLPKSFLENVKYLYTILDVNSFIKMFLQFEKLKQIIFDKQQKTLFELFSCDLSFIDEPFFNKNIEEMTEDEVRLIIAYLEDIASRNDDISKKLINLLPNQFKGIVFS